MLCTPFFRTGTVFVESPGLCHLNSSTISGDRMEKHPLTHQHSSFAVRHRLLQNLLASPFRIRPFMVELFAVEGFAFDRRMSRIRFRLSPVESSPRQPG